MTIIRLTRRLGGSVFINGDSVAYWMPASRDAAGEGVEPHTLIVFNSAYYDGDTGATLDLRVRESAEEVANRFLQGAR